MNVFDTDILTDILYGSPAVLVRAALVPGDRQAVAVVSVEEILRGRMAAIRQAEAGKGRIELPQAYELFDLSFRALAAFRVLPYVAAAHSHFQDWKAAKIRIGSQDMRIAAICVAHKATLITRNRRDYELIPGLTFETWT